MTRIVLVRHGQTDWNRVERFRGKTDVPLNAVGILQAQQVARELRGRYMPVSALYTSPLSRAKATADIVGQALGLPAEVLPVLGDYGFGEWEGKTPKEVREQYPEQYNLWITEPHRAQIPGGDNLQERRAQLAAAFDTLATERPDETVVLVSHRIVSKVICCLLLGLSNANIWNVDLETGSISLFQRRRSGWLTLSLNDTCHMRPLIESPIDETPSKSPKLNDTTVPD